MTIDRDKLARRAAAATSGCRKFEPEVCDACAKRVEIADAVIAHLSAVPVEGDREALYADAVNLAAERSPLGHPLPDAENRAARAGVDAALSRSLLPVEQGDPFTCADLGHEDADNCTHPDHAAAPKRVCTCMWNRSQQGHERGCALSAVPVEDDPVAAELREWVDGKRSWSDQHHGLPNEIELTARADEATIRLLIAKLDARAALDAVTARHNPKTGGSES